MDSKASDDLNRTHDALAPAEPIKSITQSNIDAKDLTAFGHEQELSRKFNAISMFALAFTVLGTWSTFAQGLSSGLTNGGPVSILWGLMLVGVCNICVALSMGELVSSMPTALGQAYWIFVLWEGKAGRACSYVCAWVNTFGWWCLAASQIAFMTDFLLAMKTLFDPEWDGASKGWVQFLIYVGITFTFTLLNAVACRKDKILPIFNDFVGVTFTALFIVFILTLLIVTGVKPNLSFQDASAVFGKWINETGWPDGVVWFTGLVQAAYGLTAFDSVIHMVEEIPNPRRTAPKIIWLSVASGWVSGWLFMLVCLFCIQDWAALADSEDIPFIPIVTGALGRNGGAVLIAIFIFNGLCQGASIVTTASRLTWGFARDGGLPFSNYLMRVNPYWKAPVRALWTQGVIIGLVGVLYLFSDTTLQAILSVSTIALTISYAMPIVVLLAVGRHRLAPGPFKLGRLGTTINVVSIVYCVVTTVMFFFPGSPNPSAADMNYAIAVFGVMMIISTAFWFLRGSKRYLVSDAVMVGVKQLRENEVEVVLQTHQESKPTADERKYDPAQ